MIVLTPCALDDSMIVDAVRARDHALERRRDEAAHEVRVRADVHRRHRDDGDVGARELPHGQRADRLEPRDEDDEAHDRREDGPPDEDVRELHQLSWGFGDGLFPGWTLLFTRTAAPLRSLKTPEVTTSCPSSRPETTATWSPSRAAELHEPLLDALVRAPVRALHVRDDEDGIPVRRVADRGRRERDDRVARAEERLGVHEHAGVQPAVRVRERRLDLDVPRRGVDDGVDRGDLPGERERARRLPGGDAHALARPHAGDVLLRDGKVHVDRVERLQGDDLVARREVLPEIHLADPEEAGERRANRLALDRGADLADGGLRLRLVRGGLVVVRLGDDAAVPKPAQALVTQARELELRLGGGELGRLLLHVELDEDRALLDRLAGLEVDPVDDAGKVRADDHALDGDGGADGLEALRPFRTVRDDRRHGLRGRLEGRVLRDRGADLAEFQEADRREEDGHDGQRDEHPLFHAGDPLAKTFQGSCHGSVLPCKNMRSRLKTSPRTTYTPEREPCCRPLPASRRGFSSGLSGNRRRLRIS